MGVYGALHVFRAGLRDLVELEIQDGENHVLNHQLNCLLTIDVIV